MREEEIEGINLGVNIQAFPDVTDKNFKVKSWNYDRYGSCSP